MNNFHRFQNFRQISNLFSQIWLKKDTSHSSLEFVAKSGQFFFSGAQNVIKNSHKKMQNSTQKMKHRKFINSFAKNGWRFLAEILRFERCKSMFSSSIHFQYLIFNLGSFLPKDACKSDRSRQELSNEYLVSTCKIWLRYSRERAI